MVSPQFRPIIGGYERAAERLAKGLVRRGQRVDVVTERRDRRWPAGEMFDGVQIRRVRSIPKPRLHGVSAVAAFSSYLLRHGGAYDVIHVHQYGWPAAVAIGYAHARGTPSVLKLTNTAEDGIEATLPTGAIGAGARSIHRRVSACVTTSERARVEAVAFGIPADRVHRISNPLDTAAFAPATSAERAAARRAQTLGDEFLAISVGRLNPEKNHAMLIDAWERVVTRHPKAVLAILGGGPLESAIRERVERSSARHAIRLVGSVEDPRPWYAAADTFVLPSLREGLSNSLMEALSCGLSAVCTRVSGAEDILAEADVGRIVDIGDVGGFADALCEAIADPDRRATWGRSARRYAEEHFALDGVVDRTLELYESLVGPNAPRSSR